MTAAGGLTFAACPILAQPQAGEMIAAYVSIAG